jgi:hypothetical protein
MARTLHVTFDGKVLHPEEDIDLELNARYVVTIEREEKEESNFWNTLVNLAGTVEGPEDWSAEHDHYLYGTPKRKK